MSDIFISYAHEDYELAKLLASVFESNGWSVWWDRKLKSGDSFDNVIQQQMNLAKCVIVIWSKDSVQSQYVRAEASYANDIQKFTPITIEVDPPFPFQNIHTMAFGDWDGSRESALMEKLSSDIAEIISGNKVKTNNTEGTSKQQFEQVNLRHTTESKGFFAFLKKLTVGSKIEWFIAIGLTVLLSILNNLENPDYPYTLFETIVLTFVLFCLIKIARLFLRWVLSFRKGAI